MPTIPNVVNGKVKKVLTGKTGPLDTYFKNLRTSEDAAALSRISFEKSTRADEARKEREEDAKRRKLEKRREERNATRRKAYAEKSAYENENEGASDIDGVVFDVEAMNLNLLKEDTFYDNDESIEEIDGQGDNDLEEKKKEDDNKEDEEDLPSEDD